MNAQTTPPARGLGMPFLALLGLAVLAVPRVVLHDLQLLEEGTPAGLALVVLPPVVWIVVALAARVPNAFVTLLIVGLLAGVLMALTHQLLWVQAFGAGQPMLGGNLAGLDPLFQTLLMRFFATLSSLATGALMGAVAGAIAWVIGQTTRGRNL